MLAEDEHYVVYLEGHLYGMSGSRLDAELRRLGRLLCAPDSNEADVARWLLDTPGEFLVAAFDKISGCLVVLNDALGHLPVYYYCNDDTFVASRELRFVSALKGGGVSFDRRSLAEYLLFSYPLEQRTLIADVYGLPPAAAIRIDTGNPQPPKPRTYHRFDCDQRRHADRSVSENAARLGDLLVQQCRAAGGTLADATHVLSLSGGLDSRVVLGAMNAAEVPFSPVTRRDPKALREGDVSVAGQLASALKKEVGLIDLDAPLFDDAMLLLYLKGGTNYLPMSFMLPYLKNLGTRYGQNVVYWSGDTGLVLRRHLPKRRLRDEDQLVDLVLRRQGVLKLEEVASLLSMSPDMIRGQLKSVLGSFPERSLEQRYVHFVLAGRIMKWHYEGMDRNRCFFWLCAPLEFTQVFDYAMNCPEEQKTNYKLYRELLMRLCPQLTVFPGAPYTVAPAARRFSVEMRMRSWFRSLPAEVVDFMRVILRRQTVRPRPGPEIQDCLRRQVLGSEAVRECFSVSGVEGFLQRCDHLSAKLLLTVTSSMEMYSGGEMTLSRYTGVRFT
jgi:asparagine synthase (glutamine-hydrolysing)